MSASTRNPGSQSAYRCPVCGGSTKVLSTRIGSARPHENWKPEGMRRRRECMACGFRLTTTEIPLSEYRELVSRTGSSLEAVLLRTRNMLQAGVRRLDAVLAE